MICPKLLRLCRPYESLSRRVHADKPRDWDNDPFLKFFTTKKKPYHEEIDNKFLKWWNRTFALQPANAFYLCMGFFVFYCYLPRLYHIYPKLTLSDEEFQEWSSRLDYISEERKHYRAFYIPLYHDFVPSREEVYKLEKQKPKP
ncbi:hypothetical protein DdX_02629 [Ditylenchus destructor]|uniref:Transmembrane protein n=1 Tax=Ditylenchus destructor TaxID=166010 RepID=A0AAD4R9A8_9BILA|nr:hypothetical protein DdX_02629 [Ditylenchus destructor]